MSKEIKTFWWDINITTQAGKIIKLDNRFASEAYDEIDTMFVNSPKDNTVYGFSVKSGRQKAFLSITKGFDGPSGLAIDKKK